MKYKMKRLLVFTFIVVLLYMNITASISCPLIPYPNNIKKVHATFELTSRTNLIYDEEFADIAYFFQKELLRTKGFCIPLQLNSKDNKTKQAVLLLLNKPHNQTNKENTESFSVKMNTQQIIIEANRQAGAFYGMISLLQLTLLSEIENNKIILDCWDIDDSPEYEWRGLMLDESRHFFGKEKVKQLLDWMAIYKLNRFHWHLTDAPGWRIEIKKYPKLTYVGGIGNHTNPYIPAQYYTQEDIKEIVQYASERFIEILPEIDMPGHASAANRAYPEFSGGGSKRFPEFTFNPGKDTVYDFLTDVIKEVDALFPFQMIHLGGDEVHFGNEKWKTDTDVQNLMKREKIKDLKGVENYFIKRMADSVFSINNKIAAWDEVADSDLQTDKTIVFYWRNRLPEQLQKSIEKGFSIVLCPNYPFYLDYRQDSILTVGHNPKIINTYKDIYNFDPLQLSVNFKDNTKILGVQGNIWSERITTNERLEFMVFPRIAALAENSWNNVKNRNISLFDARLKKHIKLYRNEGIFYFNPFNPIETYEPKK